MYPQLALLAAMIALMTGPASAAEGLKVGAIFAMSGAQSTYGEESLNGMDLALSDLAKSNPALAAKVTVVREDDKSNPIDAATAVKKVLNVDHVDIVFGTVASSNTLAMTAAVIAAGKPLVTPASTNPEVTKRGDMIFRTCFIDPFQGSVLANFALHHLDKKRAAILLDHKSDYSKGLAQYFEVAFKAGGGTVVANESYEAGKKDFKTQLIKIRGAHPDVLLVPGYYQEVGLVMKQAQQMGFKVTMMGGDGWDSPTLFELAGADAVKDHYFSTHFAPDDKDPAVQKFVTDYTARYHKAPGAMAALGYDGILAIVDAYKRAGTNDAPQMQKALASLTNFPGVSGTLNIDAKRDAVKEAVVLKTLADRAVFAARVGPNDGKKSH